MMLPAFDHFILELGEPICMCLIYNKEKTSGEKLIAKELASYSHQHCYQRIYMTHH